MSFAVALVLVVALNASPHDWREFKSAHFTLRTDLDEDEALEAAQEIERTRTALLAAMWPAVHEAGVEPVDVIVLRDKEEFERYAGPGGRGLYSHTALPPRIVMWGAPGLWEERLNVTDPATPAALHGPQAALARANRLCCLAPQPAPTGAPPADSQLQGHLELVNAGSTSVLKHELTHHVATTLYSRLPLWLSEGQAQFLESLRLSADGRTATLDLINPVAWVEFRRNRTVTAEDAVQWQTPVSALPQAESAGLYSVSWQLYQWLFATHLDGLHCFQQGLAGREEWHRAWARCLPGLDPKELDQTLWEFSRAGSPPWVDIPVPAVGVDVSIRPLTEAEIHLVHAQIALAAPRRKELVEEARTEVQRALAADPSLVAALQLVVPYVPPPTRLVNARRAVAAHPDDGWAWLLLGDALWDTQGPADERNQAYRRAVELQPDSALVLARAARNLLSRSEVPEALELAERAAQLAPGDGEVLAIDALALAASGRCDEGLSLGDQARKLLPTGTAGFGTAYLLDVGFSRACPRGSTAPDAGDTTVKANR